MLCCCSIIIFPFDQLLVFLDGAHVQDPVLEGDGFVVFVSQQLHYHFLPASFEGGLVSSLEAEVAFVDGRSSDEFLLGDSPLGLDGIFAEEVVAVEGPVAGDEGAPDPDGSYPPQPPGVGLSDEVCVVKHNYYQLPLSSSNHIQSPIAPMKYAPIDKSQLRQNQVNHCLLVPAMVRTLWVR